MNAVRIKGLPPLIPMSSCSEETIRMRGARLFAPDFFSRFLYPPCPALNPGLPSKL